MQFFTIPTENKSKQNRKLYFYLHIQILASLRSLNSISFNQVEPSSSSHIQETVKPWKKINSHHFPRPLEKVLVPLWAWEVKSGFSDKRCGGGELTKNGRCLFVQIEWGGTQREVCKAGGRRMRSFSINVLVFWNGNLHTHFWRGKVNSF